ncbi:MAG TPA: glycosyltransferase family 9 protein [Spirochaetota bacterium]|nr:glycosyltransferase family 9 protein [Spirochaetota bacterium]
MKVKIDRSLRERPVKKLLIIGNHLLGDSIATLHLLFSLKKHFHHTSFHLLTSNYSREVYEKMGIFDEILCYNKKQKSPTVNFHRFGFLKLLRIINRINADLVIILPTNFIFAFISFILRIPRRLGFSKGMQKFFLTGHMPLYKKMPNEENYRSILRCFPYHIRERNYYYKPGKYRIRLSKPYFSVAPCATDKKKEWAEDNFITVIKFLQREYNLKTIILGLKSDKDKLDRIAKATGSLNLAGKTTTDEAFFHINKSAFFLGNDSGLAQVAANMSVLTVILLGPTDPVQGRPWGKRVVMIYNEKNKKRKKNNTAVKKSKITDLSVNKVIDVLANNRFFRRNLKFPKHKH